MEKTKNSKTLIIGVSALLIAGLGFTAYQVQNSKETAPTESTTPPTSEVTQKESSSNEQTSSSTSVDLEVDDKGLSKSTVVIKTTKGVIKYKFYTKDAPNHVNRMVELIQKSFYNGLTFHRVEPGFVIQGGDPNGNGTGGSGKNINAEFNKRPHLEGTVAMARANDPNSADSQFYICLGAASFLDGKYTVFGQVTEGLDVVQKIQVGDKMESVIIQ